jgi:CPA2 family monovalent cation:H+ antiporter-2
MVFTPFMIQGSGRFSDVSERLPLPPGVRFGRFQEEKIEKKDLKDHVIIVGFGLNGRNVSRALDASRIPFIVLELNPETVRSEKKRGIPIIYADASHESVLTKVNILNARSVLIAISDASATRRIVELARRLNPSVYIIARTRYTNEINPLYSLGANDVIPEEFETSVEIISRVLHRYFIPVNEIEKHIRDIRKDGYEMLRKVDHKHALFPELKQHLPDSEMETFRIKDGSSLAGKTLAEVGFRQKFGVTVLAIQRGKETITNPAGNTQLISEDIVILIGTRNNISRISAMMMPPEKQEKK